MNILHKEALTVVVTTLATSGMILLTGNGVADSATVVSKSKDTVTSSDNHSAKQFIHDKNVTIAPPPGPFLNLGALVINSKIMRSPSTVIAPTKPIKNIKRPNQPIESMQSGVVPTQPKKVVVTKVELKKPAMPFAPLRPSFLLEKPEVPKFVQKNNAGLISPKLKLTSRPVAPVNHYKKPQINPLTPPVWMQQDYNKINALKLNQRAMLATNNKEFNNRLIQRQAPNMGSNGVGNFPAQRYRYVPIPMLQPSFVMPKAPVFRANSAPAPMPATKSKQNKDQSVLSISESMKKGSN